MQLENKELKAFIQAKCEELLAPLYAELEALQVQPKEEEMPLYLPLKMTSFTSAV